MLEINNDVIIECIINYFSDCLYLQPHNIELKYIKIIADDCFSIDYQFMNLPDQDNRTLTYYITFAEYKIMIRKYKILKLTIDV
jgi:hypothetical protein